MPKAKTNKGIMKRVKITKRGNIKRRKSGHSHLLSGKSPKRRRSLRHPQFIDDTCFRAFQRAIPGLKKRKKGTVNAQSEK